MRAVSRTGLRVGASLVCFGLACEPESSGPCLAWADPNLSYTVEVLDRTETQPVAGGPYASCGDARLFMETGDVLPMELRPAGGVGCDAFGPAFPLPGVNIVDGPHFGTGLIALDGLNVFMTVDLADCPVGVTFSIGQYLGTEVASSDLVLIRNAGAHAASCVPDDFPALESGCADTWFVKITDENGRVVTRHPLGS